jgi:hypothetical protein
MDFPVVIIVTVRPPVNAEAGRNVGPQTAPVARGVKAVVQLTIMAAVKTVIVVADIVVPERVEQSAEKAGLKLLVMPIVTVFP